MNNAAFWSPAKHLWITSKDMKNARINTSLMKISDAAVSQMTVYDVGTLLLVVRSGILRHSLPLAVLDSCATINQDLKAISCYDKSLCEYLYFAIKAQESYILKQYHKDGTTVDSIDFERFQQFLLPLPPLGEQRRIVSAIEQWFSLIGVLEQGQGELERLIRQARAKVLDLALRGKLVPQDPTEEPASELLQRILPDAKITGDNGHHTKFPENWGSARLHDICSFLSRGKSPKYAECDKTYPVFAQKCNLKDGGISLAQARFLDPTTIHKWSEAYKLRTGDILVNSTGTGTVGRTGLFHDKYLGDYPFVVPDSHVTVIRAREVILPEYLYACLSSKAIQQYLQENLTGSTNQKELYIGVLANLEIGIPPLAEQKRIVQKIDQLFVALDTMKKALEV